MVDVITWENIPMSQSDGTTIGQYIEQQIALHNDDPTAHLAPGQSIEVHRTSEVVDHLAGSVVPDKMEINPTEFSQILGYRYSIGEYWETMTMPAALDWGFVAYGAAGFIATTYTTSTTAYATSADGVTWTARAMPTGRQIHSVAAGNGIYVAFGRNSTTQKVFTSTDGINWSEYTSPVTTDYTQLFFVNGKFFCFVSSGSTRTLKHSTDGQSWTSATLPASKSWASIAYGGGVYVIGSNSQTDSCVCTTANLTSFTTRALSGYQFVSSIAYGNGVFVGTGAGSVAGGITYSKDGVTWYNKDTTTGGGTTNVLHAAGRFVVVCSDAEYDMVTTSQTATKWISYEPASLEGWQAMAYGNNVIVAVAISGTTTKGMVSGARAVPVI